MRLKRHKPNENRGKYYKAEGNEVFSGIWGNVNISWK